MLQVPKLSKSREQIIRETRERLLSDFEFFAEKCLKIRDKYGNIVPFKLNNAQRLADQMVEAQLAECGYIRAIILKGRQQGLSTWWNGRIYRATVTAKGQKTVVMAHKASSSDALFDMTKRYQQNMPEPLRPHTKYAGKRTLSFDILDSSYLVETAGGDDIARGETLQNGHLSEVAFWPRSTAKKNFNGLMKCFPPISGVNVAIESTANGVTGVFAETWNKAVSGENGFLPIFIPWFIQAEYTSVVPEGFKRTDEEEELIARYGEFRMPNGEIIPGLCTDGQLQWRRTEIGKNGKDLFRQEYPCCPEEAFLTTGRPVFDIERLIEMRSECVDVGFTRYQHLPGSIGFTENPRGDLIVFKKFDPKTQYFIGADVAMGYRDGDYSTAIVLSDEKEVVARYKAHINPKYFAHVLNELGAMYGFARIIVEGNNQGLLTCNELALELAYPNFYTEETLDKITQEFRTKLGFRTGPDTKPYIINNLRTTLTDRSLIIRDRDIINEMMQYVVDENGKMGAEQGSDAEGEKYHDDLVMALALALHIHEDKFTPIQASDDFYKEAP